MAEDKKISQLVQLVTAVADDLIPIVDTSSGETKYITQDDLGTIGETGVKGDTGTHGDTGIQGTHGDTGNTGAKGDTGVQGDTGIQGILGDTGIQGVKGDTGTHGDTGVAGAGINWIGEWSGATTYAQYDGVSYLGTAYISNSNGNLNNNPETEPEWDVWVEKGDTGSQGDTGVQGDTGTASTIPGDTGIQGADFSIYESKKYVITNPYRNGGTLSLKGQLHCHSTGSDGVDSPTALVTAYKNASYDFITITDHDVITSNPSVAGITWLGTSCEETQHRHIIAYDIAIQSTSTIVQDIINLHNANGKMTSLAHPNWPAANDYIIGEEEMGGYYGLNFIEIYNKVVDGFGDDQFDYALSSGKKIFATAVDDCHDVSGAGFNKGWVVVKTDTNSAAAILQSLRDGNFYASSGNDISISVEGNVVTVTSAGSSNFIFYGRNGRVLKTENGVTSSAYTIVGDEMYVRVRSQKVADSTYAWSQPIFVDLIDCNDETLARDRLLAANRSMLAQAIINPNMNVAQAGTSLTVTAANAVLIDKYSILHGADGWTFPTITHYQIKIASGNLPGSFYCYRISTNGAGSGTIGNTTEHGVYHRILHGTRWLCGNGKKVTFKIRMKASVAGKKFIPHLSQRYGDGGSPSAAEELKGHIYTLTTTWKTFKITFDTNTLSGKTFGTNGNDYLQLRLDFIWNATKAAGYTDDSASNETFGAAIDIDFTQLHLYAGDKDMPFPNKTPEEELRECQQFAWLGTVRTINGIMYYQLPTTMRATPTVATASAGTIANATKHGFQITHTSNADSEVVIRADL